MNLKKSFENDLFHVINRYENTHNISLNEISIEKDKDALGEKVVGVHVDFSSLKVVKEEKREKNFFTSVLLPTVIIFIILSAIIDLFN